MRAQKTNLRRFERKRLSNFRRWTFAQNVELLAVRVVYVAKDLTAQEPVARKVNSAIHRIVIF